MAAASFVFITGGVRSGKSRFAEKAAIQRAQEINGDLHYIATGVASDSEMELRILRHQEDRARSGQHWHTWEQSTDIGQIASTFTKKDVLLVDCLTTLLNNELFLADRAWDKAFLSEVYQRILIGVDEIRDGCNQLILVSNEVFYEPIAKDDMTFSYCQLLGSLHQQFVRRASCAYLIEAGVPILMKEVVS